MPSKGAIDFLPEESVVKVRGVVEPTDSRYRGITVPDSGSIVQDLTLYS